MFLGWIYKNTMCDLLYMYREIEPKGRKVKKQIKAQNKLGKLKKHKPFIFMFFFFSFFKLPLTFPLNMMKNTKATLSLLLNHPRNAWTISVPHSSKYLRLKPGWDDAALLICQLVVLSENVLHLTRSSHFLLHRWWHQRGERITR